MSFYNESSKLYENYHDLEKKIDELRTTMNTFRDKLENHEKYLLNFFIKKSKLSLDHVTFIDKVDNYIKTLKLEDNNLLYYIFNFKKSPFQQKLEKLSKDINSVIIDFDKSINNITKEIEENNTSNENNLINNTRKTLNNKNKLLYYLRYKINIIFSIILVVAMIGFYVTFSGKPISLPKPNIKKISENLVKNIPIINNQ